MVDTSKKIINIIRIYMCVYILLWGWGYINGNNLYLHLPREYVRIINGPIENIYGNITLDIGQYMSYITFLWGLTSWTNMEHLIQKTKQTSEPCKLAPFNVEHQEGLFQAPLRCPSFAPCLSGLAKTAIEIRTIK